MNNCGQPVHLFRFDLHPELASRKSRDHILCLIARFLFGISLNDITSAFKAHRCVVIDGCSPLLAPLFNIRVDLPLKAIVRGYPWTVALITCRNRRFWQVQAQD